MKKESMGKKSSKGEVILYKSPDGSMAIDVKLEKETVWLALNQISILFDRDKSVISRHIGNIYSEGELDKVSTVAKYATVQNEGGREIKREIEYYNLDVIISVGYRVRSKRGTQFRIWASKVLKDYLIQGYALNEGKLKEQSEKIKQLEKVLDNFSVVAEKYKLEQDIFSGILKVVSDYTRALDLLDEYDYQKLKIKETTKDEKFRISYIKARRVIDELCKKFSTTSLFGKEKDNSFKSSITTIYQTFEGKELYPSIEEKGANLLYFIIKNHSFIDGNKRIAAAIFLWFLDKNEILYKPTGEKRLAENALVALCLMIAESNSKEKDVMVKVVVNLINKKN